MNIQPKIEPGSPSTNHIILDREVDETHLTETAHNFEDKTIPDLVEVLRVAYLPKTFDTVEAVLLSREKGLRDQIQLLQQNVEEEKLARLKAEEEVKKRERVCEEGKKLEQRYTTLLKELKRTGLASDRDTVEVLRKTNIKLKEMLGNQKREVEKYEGLLKEAEVARLVDRDALEVMKKKKIEFECEVKKLEEKMVEDGNELRVLKLKNGELEYQVLKLKEKIAEDENALDVLRKMKDDLEYQVLELKGKKVEDEKLLDVLKSKNGELESQVLEFRKLNEKWEEDTNELGAIREKNADLEIEVLELKKLKKKWLNDSNALEELRSKVRVMENDKKVLAEIEIEKGELKNSVNNNLETISKLKNENNTLYIKFYELVEIVAKMEDDAKLLMSVDASWGGKNEGDPPADPMVAEFGNDTVQAASLPRNEDAQPQKIESKDAQGASSASGRVKPGKDSEITILDDDDHRSISQRIHGKKIIFGPAVKDAYPSSSVTTQQKSKFTNAGVDTAKRNFSFPDIETSSDDSSDDSFLDNLPISCVVSQRKQTKM